MASWDQIRNEVRSFRASVQPTVTSIRDFVFDARRDRIYFLANDLSKSSKAPMLFRVDLPQSYSDPYSGHDSNSSRHLHPPQGGYDDDLYHDHDRDQDMDPADRTTASFKFDRHYTENGSSDEGSLSGDQDMASLVPFHPDTYQHFVQGPPSLHHTIPTLVPEPRRSPLLHSHLHNNEASLPVSITKSTSSASTTTTSFTSPAPPANVHPTATTTSSSSSCSSSSSFPKVGTGAGVGAGARSRASQATAASDTPSLTDQILAAAPVLNWVPMLSEDWIKHTHATLQHLSTERLSSFQFEPSVNRLMFPFGTAIYIGNIQEDGKVNPKPAQPTGFGQPGNLSRPPYQEGSHNALTASFNFVSVSGPLTMPRTANGRSRSGSTSTHNHPGTNASSNASANMGLDGSTCSGGRSDPKLGGANCDLVAFTRDQDIWVMTNDGVETQLTFCSRNSKKSAISCGIAEFVMQEEFHRFTNYYWAPNLPASTDTAPSPIPRSTHSPSPSQPQVFSPLHESTGPLSPPSQPLEATNPPLLPQSTIHPPHFSHGAPPSSILNGHLPKHKERILYLQVSEAMVDLVTIPRQGMQPDHEEYRYPHAGTPNAVSDMQIDNVGEPLHKRLWGRASLYKLFPWLEYIVRFGWMPDGQSVWAQLLDRRQQITAIVVIPLDCFMSVAEQAESSDQMEDELARRIRVVYEEQSDSWINVTDIMHIFPTPRVDLPRNLTMTADTVQFIISSERTGFRHLYLATHSTQSGLELVPITSGSYQIVDKQITVDAGRQLVYFHAKKDSVLESHLYVASYARGARPENVKRLTELGYSHQATVDVEKSRFLTLYSSMDQSPACAVFHLRWPDCRARDVLDMLPIEGVYDSTNAPWCACGCQMPKISSHAFVIREGSVNLSARHVHQSPIVPVSSFNTATGHGRSSSDRTMGGASRSEAMSLSSSSSAAAGASTLSPLGTNVFKSGSMNSISGFLASHLIGSNLLPAPRAALGSESSLVVSHGPNGSSAPTSSSMPTSVWTRRASLRLGQTQGPMSDSGNSSVINASHHPAGEFFTFMTSDNVLLHGCLYRPANYVVGQKYPTLVSIYGGPRSQMVTNEYKLPKFLRVFLATRLGLAVVMVDGRGSNDRGVEFERPLRHQMGQVEIRDQVEGLQFLAKPENGGLVDMDHVAISGWSYGGYLSLMALAQYPEIFKVAIAGAPVTQWELYNSAYTERYMGLVHENKGAYAKSNVLHWADKFPDSEHRLLIAHGLIDENVHFTNTETLVAELVRNNKPHQIQLYPTERHGLRDARVNEHFETLMFFWLKNFL
ncbi:dipeptidylpeptidase [Podila epigama]|nr:dipeptidylpeptidase [Podila epigama]